MKRRLLYTLLAFLLVLLGALVAIWFLRTHEKAPHELAVPGYGEPTFNPLFALRQTLIRDGVDARSRPRLALDEMALLPVDTVVMLEDPGNLTPTEVHQLLAWVASGGHLVVRSSQDDNAGPSAATSLLHQLGVLNGSRAAKVCLPWKVDGDALHHEFCRGHGFRLMANTRAQHRWGDDDSDLLGYARLPHGRGHVDVLADLDFLLNTGDELGGGGGLLLSYGDNSGGLRDNAHRDLARLVLAPNYDKGTVHLVYRTQRPSLWMAALQHGWMVWVPLLLALFGALWRRAQRFGPWLPSPRQHRRSLLEHIRASGEHLLRHGHTPLLYTAVQRAFLTRLHQRLPLAAALDGAARAQAIADHLHLPLGDVADALQMPPSRDHRALRDRIRLLLQMRNQL